MRPHAQPLPTSYSRATVSMFQVVCSRRPILLCSSPSRKHSIKAAQEEQAGQSPGAAQVNKARRRQTDKILCLAGLGAGSARVRMSQQSEGEEEGCGCACISLHKRTIVAAVCPPYEPTRSDTVGVGAALIGSDGRKSKVWPLPPWPPPCHRSHSWHLQPPFPPFQVPAAHHRLDRPHANHAPSFSPGSTLPQLGFFSMTKKTGLPAFLDRSYFS